MLQRCIVEVLGLERRFIDDGIAWVVALDDVLLYELHDACSLILLNSPNYDML